METTVHIQGANEIYQAMKSLPVRMDRKLLNKSLTVGGRLIRDEARRRVPLLRVPDARRIRGALQKAIHAGAVRSEEYTASVWVRVRKPTRAQVTAFRKKTGKAGSANPLDAFYWMFVEFGTSKMSARPFMRPAFESRKHEAVNATINDLRPRVQAEVARLGSRR